MISKFSVRGIFHVLFIICLLLGTHGAKSQSKAGSLSNGFIPEVATASGAASKAVETLQQSVEEKKKN